MRKLIQKKDITKDKEKLSKAFGCLAFEPEECCYCREVDRFINELSKKEHDPMFCNSE